MFTHT
jgi:hypothetical protein